MTPHSDASDSRVQDLDARPRRHRLVDLAAAHRGRGPAIALVLLLAGAHGVVVASRYGFLDDYALLYQSETGHEAMTSHILGGGRPVFALLYLLIFGPADTIAHLSVIRGLTLVLTCVVGLVLLRLLRAVGTSPWTAAATAGLLLVLPAAQVSVAWATMFIVPVSMIFALTASGLLLRDVLEHGRVRPPALILPVVLLSLAVTSYQPGAMSFWLGLAIVVLGGSQVRHDLPLLLRLWGASLVVCTASLVVGFVVLRVGVATQAVSGERAGTVTDVPGKVEWFLTVALPRALDPWSLTPRPLFALAVATVLVVGVLLLDAPTAWRRAVNVAMASSLVVLSYVPNLLVAENWASTRTMVALMPMVALLATFAGRELLRRLAMLVRTEGPGVLEPVLLGLLTLSFALHAAQVVRVWFVTPQQEEIAAAADFLAAHGDVDELVVVRSEWFDSISPTVHYDEYGVPSSCQPSAALGLTQLLLREQTGRFAGDVRLVERDALPLGPQPTPVLDYRLVLQSTNSGRAALVEAPPG
jgi:hypothetical protein